MNRLMGDSRLNGAEQFLQRMFRKRSFFNILFMAGAVIGAYAPIRALPDRRSQPPQMVTLSYRPVALPSSSGPFQLGGAWEVKADDSRLGGLSALAIDGDQFLTVSDSGTVISIRSAVGAAPIGFAARSAGRARTARQEMGEGRGIVGTRPTGTGMVGWL